MKILGIALAAIAAVFTLTACGSDNTSASINEATDAVVKEYVGGETGLTCKQGLMRLDLPLGTTEESNGTKFELVETAKAGRYGSSSQESVKLTVKLDPAMALPAIIVRADRGTDIYGRAQNKPLVLNVGRGGKSEHVLVTAAYTSSMPEPYGAKIHAVTLCINQSGNTE